MLEDGLLAESRNEKDKRVFRQICGQHSCLIDDIAA